MASTDYLDVISFRPRGDKPFAHRIGSAKSNGKGGYNVYLDSLPIPDKDGKVTLLISPRRDAGGSRAASPSRRAEPDDDFNDSIPF